MGGGGCDSCIPEDLYLGPVFDEQEVDAAARIIRSGKITQLSSSVVGEFEAGFASYVGAEAAVAVSCGTAAVHTALAACGIGPGDEVIVPAFTFIGTAGPVLYQGAVPVFADIEPDTYCISVEDAAAKITSRTKAIIPVDLFGHPADLDAVHELAKKHGLVVIEDACQSHGAEYKGRRLGGISRLTCFSFQESKNMTTGEGGMVTSTDPTLAAICRKIRNQGRDSQGRLETVGYNYRMTALQAAIGLVQLRKLDGFNSIRRKLAQIYSDALREFPVQLPGEREDAKSVYHVYSFLLPDDLASRRDEIVSKMVKARIPAGAVYSRPLYADPVFQGCRPAVCPVAENVSRRVVSLSTAHSIPAEIAERIGAAAHGVLQEYMG